MAKGSGYTRASKWSSKVKGARGLYYEGNERKLFRYLSDAGKALVREERNRVLNNMTDKFKDVSVILNEDGGKPLEVHFTKPGLDHFCNDAMIKLSGLYFSENSMMNIDEILRNSEYIPTEHASKQGKHLSDGREKWFYYADTDGRGVYFSVSYNSVFKVNELYSVSDTLPVKKKN